MDAVFFASVMRDSMAARYQQEKDALERCRKAVYEMNGRGDKSSKDRNRMNVRLWKIEMRLSGMRSMAKAVGLDPSALDAPSA